MPKTTVGWTIIELPHLPTLFIWIYPKSLIIKIVRIKIQYFLEFFHNVENDRTGKRSLDHSPCSVCEIRFVQIRIITTILRTSIVNHAFVIFQEWTWFPLNSPSRFIIWIIIVQIFFSELQAARSGDPFAVQKLLGHADLKMATRYVQDVSKQTDEVVEKSRSYIL